jgi:hypothetical protein
MIGRMNRSISPMPSRLDTPALLRVSDQSGRVVRSEILPAETALRERLRIAHENYGLQAWNCGELRAGQWAFSAMKGAQRVMVAVRPFEAVTGAASTAVPVATTVTGQ